MCACYSCKSRGVFHNLKCCVNTEFKDKNSDFECGSDHLLLLN